MKLTRRLRAALLAIALLACSGGDELAADASVDSGSEAPDAAPDAGDGLVQISGDCGVLDDELSDDLPSAFNNVLTFDHAFVEADEAQLSDGGREIIADGNAGGSSLLSEVFAFEVLSTCEGSALVKTETEIVYDGPSKKTDFLAEIAAVRIGVSVTRAQTFPLGEPLTVDVARNLLDGKLADILESTANVSEADRWEKQILAVLVYNRQHLASLESGLEMIDAETRADTIVWMTVTDGPDQPIYD